MSGIRGITDEEDTTVAALTTKIRNARMMSMDEAIDILEPILTPLGVEYSGKITATQVDGSLVPWIIRALEENHGIVITAD